MLLVDSRAGSKDLIKPLKKLLGDVVEEATLSFGDVAFNGRGANDVILDIGVEFKSLGDIVQCCRDGRFAGHQLPGMRKSYDYSFLLIEGQWRHDDNGYLATYMGPRIGWKALPGKMSASEFEKHLFTFQFCGGAIVHMVNTRADSVRFLSNLYRWWSDRPLDAHTSHLALYQPATFAQVSDVRKTIATLPGIGVKISRAVETHFNGSLYQAFNATAAEWAEIEGVGKQKAHSVVKYIRVDG